MSNSIRDELLKKSRGLLNRGAYPFTKASNVYMQNGMPMEDKDNNEETPTIPDTDVTFDPKDPDTTIADILNNMEDGQTLAISSGDIQTEMSVTKSTTIYGSTAGISKNSYQNI